MAYLKTRYKAKKASLLINKSTRRVSYLPDCFWAQVAQIHVVQLFVNIMSLQNV